MFGDPAAGGQLLEQRLVEPTRRAVADVLDRRLAVPQPSGAQSGLEAPGTAIGGLAVEQQRQPFGVREIAGLLLRFELDEGLDHAVEVERSELIKGRMGEHWSSSPQWKKVGPRMLSCAIAGPSPGVAGRWRSRLFLRIELTEL
jgi:hypothetical protein